MKPRKIAKCNSLARKELRSKETLPFAIFVLLRALPAKYDVLAIAALQKVAQTREKLRFVLAKGVGVGSKIQSLDGGRVGKIAAFTPLALAPTGFCTKQPLHRPAFTPTSLYTMSELRPRTTEAASGRRRNMLEDVKHFDENES